MFGWSLESFGACVWRVSLTACTCRFDRGSIHENADPESVKARQGLGNLTPTLFLRLDLSRKVVPAGANPRDVLDREIVGECHLQDRVIPHRERGVDDLLLSFCLVEGADIDRADCGRVTRLEGPARSTHIRASATVSAVRSRTPISHNTSFPLALRTACVVPSEFLPI